MCFAAVMCMFLLGPHSACPFLAHGCSGESCVCSARLAAIRTRHKLTGANKKNGNRKISNSAHVITTLAREHTPAIIITITKIIMTAFTFLFSAYVLLLRGESVQQCLVSFHFSPAMCDMTMIAVIGLKPQLDTAGKIERGETEICGSEESHKSN